MWLWWGALALHAAQKRELLAKHNDVRRMEGASNMRKLLWSKELAEAAGRHAAECRFGASNATARVCHGLCGENLYASTELVGSAVTQAVEHWASQKADWDWQQGRFHASQCRAGKQCEHYTQAVWADAMLVGCARADCSGSPGAEAGKRQLSVHGLTLSTFLVCEYALAGNRESGALYDRGQPCSACPPGYGCCERGLCVGRPPPLLEPVELRRCGSGGAGDVLARGRSGAVHPLSSGRVRVHVAARGGGWVGRLRTCADQACTDGAVAEWPLGACENGLEIAYGGELPAAPGPLANEAACASPPVRAAAADAQQQVHRLRAHLEALRAAQVAKALQALNFAKTFWKRRGRFFR